jgi:putative phosphoesterase
MTTQKNVTIGLLSDIHASLERLTTALARLDEQKAETILCAGDIIGFGREPAECLRLVRDRAMASCRGNHERWFFEQGDSYRLSPVPIAPALRGDERDFLSKLPAVLTRELAGVRLLVTHGRPGNDMEGLLPERSMDDVWQFMRAHGAQVIVTGHTHAPLIRREGDLVAINPGSVRFSGSCAVLRLPTLETEIITFAPGLPLGF